MRYLFIIAAFVGLLPVAARAEIPKAPCEAPKHTETQAKAMYDEALAAIQRAGEHPSDKDLSVILPLLEAAADAGFLEAQLKLGHYVYGYWATDEMFWPSQPELAMRALSFLRVAALRIKTPSDDLLSALAKTPPVFPEDGPPAPPSPWLSGAVAQADAWMRCRPDIFPPSP